jgi:hypothetical protein
MVSACRMTLAARDALLSPVQQSSADLLRVEAAGDDCGTQSA